MESRALSEMSRNSKVAKKLSEEQARFEAAINLKKRIMKLADRKKNPMSMGNLCKKHGLDIAVVSKVTTGARLPEQGTIDAINKALKAEGE